MKRRKDKTKYNQRDINSVLMDDLHTVVDNIRVLALAMQGNSMTPGRTPDECVEGVVVVMERMHKTIMYAKEMAGV